MDQNALALALVSTDGELLGLYTGVLSLPFFLFFFGISRLPFSLVFDRIVFLFLVESLPFDFGQARDLDPSGWELALVTTPSNDISAATERQLVRCILVLVIMACINYVPLTC